jgi:hypothetical protein
MSAPALWVLYHQERPVDHDEPSQARGCFEVWQLRHGGHDPAFEAKRCGFENPRLRLSHGGP